ncbi:MAG: PEP-CTERM sorting domain-containing protein [Planctomycetota bacterium]|nr:MAG: PEP-CTERM sorting domain-containing protein [Planctomycetota bacterium]REJ97357.1 MAG: PEP-CTERM sorting domain-containing protein [Planctomycetota bacterium]REK27732.1 MAG: PEP-CTERM sorting domain-containing protein [Planctomycetota bacterium]REK48127.1 MAG: PEP-CTERM sorting domain-containing protein [Planctomycetota bacterium]
MKSLKFLAAFLSICLIAGLANAAPVNIANADLDDVPYGFSQGIPANWSTTGASWFGNPGGAHTGSNAWYAAGNGFPGPSGGNLFQDVTAAVSAAFGGLTTGVQYTLTSCMYIKNSTSGVTLGIKQFSATGLSGTTVSQTIPAANSTWQLWTHTQTFTYLGSSIWLDTRWGGNNGANVDTFRLSTGTAHAGTTTAPIPEPSSFAMLGIGLLGLGYLGVRRVRK